MTAEHLTGLQSLYCTTEQLRELRIRDVLWWKKGRPAGDADLFPVFNLLTNNAHIVPVFSCAGHRDCDRSYIMFGHSERGLNQLMQLLAGIRAAIKDSAVAHQYRVSLILMSNLWPCGEAKDRRPYPTAILEYNYDSPAEREVYLKALIEQSERLVKRWINESTNK